MCIYKDKVQCKVDRCDFVTNRYGCELYKKAHINYLLADVLPLKYSPRFDLTKGHKFVLSDDQTIVKSFVASNALKCGRRVVKRSIDTIIDGLVNNTLFTDISNLTSLYVTAKGITQGQCCFLVQLIHMVEDKYPNCVVGVYGPKFCEFEDLVYVNGCCVISGVSTPNKGGGSNWRD